MLLVLVSIFLRVGILASKNPVHGDKTVTAREFFSKRRVVEDVGLEFPQPGPEPSSATLSCRKLGSILSGVFSSANPRPSWLEGRFELAVHPNVTWAPLELKTIYLPRREGCWNGFVKGE